MKTTVTNSIYFADGLDTQLCNNFKRIFPKNDLEVNLWDFQKKRTSTGWWKLTLEIDINYYGGPAHKFTYSKSTSDMPMIDKLNDDETGSYKRKVIMNVVSNDNFIELLEEFLDSINIKKEIDFED